MATPPGLHVLIATDGPSTGVASMMHDLINPSAVARVTVLAVVLPPSCDPLLRFGALIGAPMSQTAVNHLLNETAGAAWAAARQLATELRHLTPHVSPVVRIGFPVEEILATAHEAAVDLIVIEEHVSGSWRTVLFGPDIAQEVLRRAPCPVLVIGGHRNDTPGSGGRGRRLRARAGRRPAPRWRCPRLRPAVLPGLPGFGGGLAPHGQTT